MSGALEALGKSDLFRGLDETLLAEIAARSTGRRYSAGERIVSELEPGEDVYVLTDGEAEVSVDAEGNDKRVLMSLGRGGVIGEMASVTGELRSATVTAVTDVGVVVISDADFDRLREQCPEVAVRIVKALGTRLAAAEKVAEALLTRQGQEEALSTRPLRRGSLSRVWRELVVSHSRDLAFLTLSAFVLTLVVVRLAVFLSFHFDVAPRGVLRTAYLSGFFLVIGSACTSLLTFRPGVRRAIALAYGVGLALILNEIGVTLAFDIFFKDIHTPDPNVPFDIERLYRRTEPFRFITIGLLVLVQAAYLRRFYRRAAFVVATRLRKVMSRK